MSHFDTSHVTDMTWMFGGLDLYHIDLSSFDTSNVTSMLSMFNGDSNLESVNLSGFDGSGISNSQGTFFMFYQNHSLDKITLSPKMTFRQSPFLGVYGYNSHLLPQPSDTYTGKWQGVGSGSVLNPLGTKFDSGANIVTLYTDSTTRPTSVETYVWEPVNRETRVTAKYVDESGDSIADDAVTDYGIIGSTDPGYTTAQLAIDGYTFDKVIGNTSGAYPSADATVTYVYKKAQAGGSTGTGSVTTQAKPVTVHYVTENGTKIAPDKTLTGNYGASYRASELSVKGYALIKDSGNTTGTFTATPQTVTYTYRQAAALKAVASYPVVSSIKKIGLYRTKSFGTQNHLLWYAKQPRTKWPMFVVTGEAVSKAGHLRYHVRDVNHGSATFGKTGYITANAHYIVRTYYAKRATHVKVLAAHGITAYQHASLTGKSRRYQKGQRLSVKRLVTYHKTTRFQLTNGKYISANKKLVESVK